MINIRKIFPSKMSRISLKNKLLKMIIKRNGKVMAMPEIKRTIIRG